jgi:hypothetical protein
MSWKSCTERAAGALTQAALQPATKGMRMYVAAKKHGLQALAILIWLTLAACAASPTAEGIVAIEQEFNASSRPADLIATDPNLKVAFIGDSGNGAEFEAVLTLIKNEGTDLVLHQGDFDYAWDADGFFAKIDRILGPNFPYLASVGNHDIASWNTGCGDLDGCYAQFVKDRMARTGIEPDEPDLNDQMYSVTYRGLKMVFVGQERWGDDSLYPRYIHSQLAADPHTWRICSWHRNQNAMQIGGKNNEMGWGVYDVCRINGAIVATGHEHSYARTKTLISMQNQAVDTTQHPPLNGVPGDPDQLLVVPGRSFVFVSGLGGTGMRPQQRCQPATYPYGGGPGCNHIWAEMYSTDQTGGVERFGALFITFNYNGDPVKARGYFKTSAGEIIDEFDISAGSAAAQTDSTTLQ